MRFEDEVFKKTFKELEQFEELKGLSDPGSRLSSMNLRRMPHKRQENDGTETQRRLGSRCDLLRTHGVRYDL
jgi:hypothetical protein